MQNACKGVLLTNTVYTKLEETKSVFLTVAPMNDHVMLNDVTFIIRRCARAARGDDVIVYDGGNLFLLSCALVRGNYPAVRGEISVCMYPSSLKGG